MPLLDGYDRTYMFSRRDLEVSYRPITHRMRRALFAQASSVSQEFGLGLVAQQAAKCIMAWDWGEKPTPEAILAMRGWEQELFEEIVAKVLGVGESKEEEEDAANLSHGVRLALLYPGTSKLNCVDCQRFWCDPLSGTYVVLNGEKVARTTERLLCQTLDGCPVGSPENPRRLSEKNKLAYEHHKGCEATGNFPDDCWVKKNAKIIGAAQDRIERECRTQGSSSG